MSEDRVTHCAADAPSLESGVLELIRNLEDGRRRMQSFHVGLIGESNAALENSSIDDASEDSLPLQLGPVCSDIVWAVAGPLLHR